MKKHTFQENYEKIFGPVKEDWWDDMDEPSQAQYIKDHPGSKQAQQADKDSDGDEMTSFEPGMDFQGFQKAYADSPDGPEMKLGSAKDAWEKYQSGELSKPDSEPEDKPSDMDPERPSDEPSDMDTERPSDEPEGDSSSEHAAKVQSVSDIDDIDNLGSDSDFDQKFDDIKDQGSGYKDEYGKEMNIDDLHYKVKMLAAGEDSEDFLGDFEDEDELVDAWKDSVGKAMAGKQGRTGNELNQETLTIDGKQYRRISEVEKEPKPKYEFSEFYQRFKR